MAYIYTKTDCVDDLRSLCAEMEIVSSFMKSIGEERFIAHAKELRSAAGLAEEWANSIEEELGEEEC